MRTPPRILAIDPRDSQRLYAGVFRGVSRSTDGGRTWSLSTNGFPTRDAVLDIEIDLEAPDTLYALTSASGVFKSTDAGATWRTVGPGLEGVQSRDLFLDPHDRSTLYVATLSDGLQRLTQRR